LPVLGFTIGAAFLSALVFGLVPALRATRADPSRELQGDGRGATGSRDRSAARGLVVMAQVAVMMVLLVGAGLLLQSFQAVMRVEPGFDEDVLTARLSLPRADYADIHRMSRFYRDLEGRLSRLPGVSEVAAVNHVPLNGALASADYKVADRAPVGEDQLPTAQYRMVTPAYFRAMGVPLRAGRSFDDDDREGGALVAIITESLARQSFPDRSPVGERLLVRDNPEGFRAMEIVGVVGDLRHSSLEGEPEPHLFVPYHQTHRELLVWLALNQFVVVRTPGAPSSMAEGLRRELHALDPHVAADDLRTTGFYVDAAAAARRFSFVLLTLFAGVGLVMAGVGIYGVVTYSVAQRRRETGVRLALGATMRDIVILILGEGLRRTFLGVLTGLLAALLASRTLRSQIYGVEATDPLSYAGAIVLLVGVTLAACLLPAWRAARSNPTQALRRG
jgi:putative ABC transport system permease protein